MRQIISMDMLLTVIFDALTKYEDPFNFISLF